MKQEISGQNGWWAAVWMVGGFLAVTGWLFLMVGAGLVLAGAVVAGVVLALPVGGAAWLATRWIGKGQRRVQREVVAATQVQARLVEATGSCARGIPYEVGGVYAFQDGKPTPAMCGPAAHALRPVVDHASQNGAGSTTVKVVCPLSGNVMTFEVYRGPEVRVPLQRAA
ncbi:MAG: hypothetical protein HY681_01725 [Chloroflexi bacterium]|nr:hypothetical protein [Chloroflexota bacterium]